jgi:hypothetical protein
MPSTLTNKNTQDMTPEEQGAFFELFKYKEHLSWLLSTKPERRRALHASLVASHHSRAETVKALGGLKRPEKFCSPLLAKAMSDKLGESLDVRGVIFQHVRSTSSLLGLRKKRVLPIDGDLLGAACENFEVSETWLTGVTVDEKVRRRLLWGAQSLQRHPGLVLPDAAGGDSAASKKSEPVQ